MIPDRGTILFFDTSCLIAAIGSPSGGSARLLELCAKGVFQGAISQSVLLEAERNIRRKLSTNQLDHFLQLLMVTPLIIAQLPDERKMQDYARMVGEKDAHVIGACLAIGASFSLTLDKRLELQINRSNLPVYALTPGEFIKTVLPKHVDYD